MFGLFDQFNTDDPTKQARLAQSLALLQAGGPSRTPVSLFQGLGMAGQAGLEAKRQAQKDAQAKLLQDMQLQQFTAQQDELKRKREQDAARQAAIESFDPANPQTWKPAISSGALPLTELMKQQGKTGLMQVGANVFDPEKREWIQPPQVAAKAGPPPAIVQAINLAYGEGTPQAMKALQAYVSKETRMPGGGGSPSAVIDAGGEDQMLLVKKYGKPSAGFRWKQDGSLEAIPGGPADLKTQAAAQRQADGASDVDVALMTLRNAYDRLEQGGGITSTQNDPMTNAAASLGSSGIGQGIGRVFGTQNQSARNDIAMARPALLAALMKATGMSAKQMDSNAELKLWLSTATDPTLDVESNRRALENIERKYITGKKIESPAPSEKPPKPAGPQKIASDADYNALPSGTEFIGPDGKRRRKP